MGRLLIFFIVLSTARCAYGSTLYVANTELYYADFSSKRYVRAADWDIGYSPELASDPRLGAFRLWALPWPSAPNSIFEIDPTSGAVVDVKQVALPEGTTLQTLAFDASSNSLYASSEDPPYGLYRINAATGAAALVGNVRHNDLLGISMLYGMAFDLEGNLWASGSGGLGSILVRLNKDDASIEQRINLRDGTTFPRVPLDIAFRPEDGVLFGISEGSLFTIDPVSGNLTYLGFGPPGGFNGLAFGPVPEPHLFWGGLFLVLIRRRGRERL
jgi:hypothetical protein